MFTIDSYPENWYLAYCDSVAPAPSKSPPAQVRRSPTKHSKFRSNGNAKVLRQQLFVSQSRLGALIQHRQTAFSMHSAAGGRGRHPTQDLLYKRFVHGKLLLNFLGEIGYEFKIFFPSSSSPPNATKVSSKSLSSRLEASFNNNGFFLTTFNMKSFLLHNSSDGRDLHRPRPTFCRPPKRWHRVNHRCIAPPVPIPFLLRIELFLWHQSLSWKLPHPRKPSLRWLGKWLLIFSHLHSSRPLLLIWLAPSFPHGSGGSFDPSSGWMAIFVTKDRPKSMLQSVTTVEIFYAFDIFNFCFDNLSSAKPAALVDHGRLNISKWSTKSLDLLTFVNHKLNLSWKTDIAWLSSKIGINDKFSICMEMSKEKPKMSKDLKI